MVITSYNKNLVVTIILILVSLCGVAEILFLASMRGPGLSPDSVAYIAAARNIIDGHGITVLYNAEGIPLDLWQPIIIDEKAHILPWPPLYPFILSITGIFGLNIIEGARWLNAILFGLNIFLVGFIIKKITKTLVLPILAAILFLFAKDIIFIHYMVWSEPLFILLAFLGLFLLINYLTEKRLLFLYLSASITGLAFLTKYSGAAVVITGIITILFLNDERIKKKIKHFLIFITISCLPVGIWLLRLQFFESGSSVRQLSTNPISIDEIKMMMDSITKWLAPGRLSLNLRIVLIVIFGIIVVTGFILINKKIKGKEVYIDQRHINRAAQSFFALLCLYIGLNFLTRFIADANLELGYNRNLTPVFIAFLIIVVLFLKSILNLVEGRKKVKIITEVLIYFIFVVFIGFYVAYFYYGNHQYTNKALHAGNGYSRYDWKTSETIEKLKEIPKSTLIYSNEPTAVYILADLPSRMLPSKVHIYTNRNNEGYNIQINDMAEELLEKDGIIVMFDIGLGFQPNKDELENDISLKTIEKFADGTIYKIDHIKK